MNRLTPSLILIVLGAAAQLEAAGAKAASPAMVRESQTSADAEYEKGAALVVEGRLDEARAIFEAAARLDPKNTDVGAVIFMFRDLDAGRVSKEAIQKIFRGMQYANEQKWTEAEAEIGEALTLSPRYARAYDTRAQLHIYQGQYDEAIKALDQALTVDPEFAQGFYDRGAVYSEMKRYDRAIADYDRAIALNPAFMEAYRNRGSARANTRRLKEAVADYTRAHELDPRAVDPLFLRGVLHAAMKEYDAAITDFSMTIERDSSLAVPYYNRGVMQQEKGNLEQAVADYEKFLKQVTDEADPGVMPLVKSARARLAALKK